MNPKFPVLEWGEIRIKPTTIYPHLFSEYGANVDEIILQQFQQIEVWHLLRFMVQAEVVAITIDDSYVRCGVEDRKRLLNKSSHDPIVIVQRQNISTARQSDPCVARR